MIVVAGVTYMTTDSFQGKSEGKDKLMKAIGGVLLALFSWIILYTLNPGLLNFDLKINQAKIAAGEWPDSAWFNYNGNVPTGTPRCDGQTVDGQEIKEDNPWPNATTPGDDVYRSVLIGQGITISSTGGNNICTEVGQPGCTSVYWEQSAPVPGKLITFKAAVCEPKTKCEIEITGGSECWLHSSHGPGKMVVDLKSTGTPNLNKFLSGSEAFPTGKFSKPIAGVGTFVAEHIGDNEYATGDHWHVNLTKQNNKILQ